MVSPVSTPARVGRPRGATAESHKAILDAVHDLLQETSVRELTMEAIAKRSGVGKPTLYKWWPSKAALVFSMFHERLAPEGISPQATTADAIIRDRMRHLVAAFNGLFGKVMAELIAEGQSDSALLRELYNRHIEPRRAATIADLERGKKNGEIFPQADPELLVDAIFGAAYYRLLLGRTPLTEGYGDALIDQVLHRGTMAPGRRASRK